MALVHFSVGGQQAGGEQDGGYDADDEDWGFVAVSVEGLFWGRGLLVFEVEKGRAIRTENLPAVSKSVQLQRQRIHKRWSMLAD